MIANTKLWFSLVLGFDRWIERKVAPNKGCGKRHEDDSEEAQKIRKQEHYEEKRPCMIIGSTVIVPRREGNAQGQSDYEKQDLKHGIRL